MLTSRVSKPFRRSVIAAALAAGLSGTFLAANGAPNESLEGGRVFVADRASGTVSVIDARTNQLETTLSLPPAPNAAEPMYVFFSPLRRRVFVGDRGNDRVVAFNARTLAVEGTAKAGAGVFHMWGNTDTKQLWVNNDVDLTVSVVDIVTLATIATVPIPADLVALGGKPHDVIVDPDGDHAYVSVTSVKGPTDYVVRYDAATFQEVDRVEVGDDPHVSLSQSDELLFVPCQDADAVYVFDRTDMSKVKIVDVPGAHGAGMVQSGATFYTTNLPGGGPDALYAIDTASLNVVGTPTDAPYDTPHNIALSRNGKNLYLTHSGSKADKVTVYSVQLPDPTPVLVAEVTVGLNPFGLAYVP
ncbi:MAG: YncE family protein [Planctomycetota bacterium]